MTTDEIRELNCRMFEAFKPEGVEVFENVNGKRDSAYGRWLPFDVKEWSPASNFNDAIECIPKDAVMHLTIAAWGSHAKVEIIGFPLGISPCTEGIKTPEAVCLALLSMGITHETL